MTHSKTLIVLLLSFVLSPVNADSWGPGEVATLAGMAEEGASPVELQARLAKLFPQFSKDSQPVETEIDLAGATERLELASASFKRLSTILREVGMHGEAEQLERLLVEYAVHLLNRGLMLISLPGSLEQSGHFTDDFGAAIVGISARAGREQMIIELFAMTQRIVSQYSPVLMDYVRTFSSSSSSDHSYYHQIDAVEHMQQEYDRYLAGEEDNIFSNLRTLVVDELADTTQKNCNDRSRTRGFTPYTPITAIQGNISGAIIGNCRLLVAQFLSRANPVIHAFNEKLAGRYPFAEIEVDSDVPPDVVVAFHEKYQKELEDLFIEYEYLLSIPQLNDTLYQIFLLSSSLEFLAAITDGVRVQPLFNPEEFSSSEFVNWGIRMGSQGSPGWRLNPVGWQSGDAVEVGMKIAAESPYRFESGDTLVFRATGDWALLRFAQRYSDMPPDRCPLNVRIVRVEDRVAHHDSAAAKLVSLRLGFRLMNLANGTPHAPTWPKRFPVRPIEVFELPGTRL